MIPQTVSIANEYGRRLIVAAIQVDLSTPIHTRQF
jgi:hypothetical protein